MWESGEVPFGCRPIASAVYGMLCGELTWGVINSLLTVIAMSIAIGSRLGICKKSFKSPAPTSSFVCLLILTLVVPPARSEVQIRTRSLG